MFRPRVAAASLSGQSDREWAREAEPYVGAAFLGGIALDDRSRKAARELVDRDREEFLPSDPIAWIDDQLESLSDASLRPAVNVRSSTVDPVPDAAAVCAEHDAIVEVNAHCRQTEMCEIGCGEALLRDSERLRRYVAAADDADATVSVKVRTEIEGVDLPEVAATIEAAGADAIHVDAMDSESVVADVVAATDAFVIANNEVRGPESVDEYLEYGADAVSVGRPSTEPAVLERVLEGTEAWFAPEVRPK